jgi:putative SOS response-associated peptidase YedK
VNHSAGPGQVLAALPVPGLAPSQPALARCKPMCGRYTESKRTADVKARIAFDQAQIELVPRFNIAPTQLAPVVVVHGNQIVLKSMRWGLIPFWAKDEAIGHRMINARAETLLDKPAFRGSLERRRCLVVADSLYEWQKFPHSKLKQPTRILLKDEQPFAFAGLWDRWTPPDGPRVESFTIITGPVNELVAPIHDRMAVILPSRHHAQWLDPGFQDLPELTRLLVPYPAEEMKAYPVGTLVNDPKMEDPRCAEPLAAFVKKDEAGQ